MQKVLLILLTINICFTTFETKAQEIKSKSKLHKEFTASKNLYVITEGNPKTYTTKNGESFTFFDLVKQNFSNKNLIAISESAYDKSDGVKDKFFVGITEFTVEEGLKTLGGVNGVLIQKGKSKYHPTKALYWMNLDLEEIENGIGVVRLKYAVENLKYILDNFDDKSFRSKLMYKRENYEKILASHTLYILKSDVYDKLSMSDIKKYYSHNVKLVTQAEYAQVIEEGSPNALFVNVAGMKGKYYAADVYTADSGKLIVSSFPWIGNSHQLTKLFFQKAF